MPRSFVALVGLVTLYLLGQAAVLAAEPSQPGPTKDQVNLELTATPLEQPRLKLGESPRWDARHKMLLMVDQVDRKVVFLKDGKVEAVDAPGLPGAIAPNAAGGWLVAVDSGLRILDEQRRWGDEIRQVSKSDRRLNDGRCDAAGRFWVGSYGDRWDVGACAFYRVDVNGKASEIFSKVTCSNGLGWSPDGKTFYYIDSGTWRVDACSFNVDSGQLGERKPILTVPQDVGVPDGLAVDSEGMLWVAIYNPRAENGLVLHYDPKIGTVIGRVTLPSAGLVTACALGGSELRDMYITTGVRKNLPAGEQQPANAGCVFCVRVPVAGLPEHAWKGPQAK